MNFGRAKTILIILFVFVNLFLIGYMFFTSNDNITPNSKTITQATEILNSRNVFLSDKIKLSASENINFLNLKNIADDEKAFASAILGKVSLKNSVYYGENGDLTIENSKFILNYNDNHKFSDYSKSEVLSYSTEFLKSKGFDTSILKNSAVEKTGENYKLSYTHYFFDMPVFNLKTFVYVSKSGVYKVEGSAFIVDSLTSSDHTNNPISVLLAYSAEKKQSEKIEIAEINSGYYSDNMPDEFELISAVPCYELVLTNGTRLYFDATSATAVK